MPKILFITDDKDLENSIKNLKLPSGLQIEIMPLDITNTDHWKNYLKPILSVHEIKCALIDLRGFPLAEISIGCITTHLKTKNIHTVIWVPQHHTQAELDALEQDGHAHGFVKYEKISLEPELLANLFTN